MPARGLSEEDHDLLSILQLGGQSQEEGLSWGRAASSTTPWARGWHLSCHCCHGGRNYGDLAGGKS